MDSLCCVRNKIMSDERVLFWYLFPSLLRNSGNKHQNNPLSTLKRFVTRVLTLFSIYVTFSHLTTFTLLQTPIKVLPKSKSINIYERAQNVIWKTHRCCLCIKTPAWINHYICYKVGDEITYPTPNFNGATTEVWEWTSNFIPYFTGYVITHSQLD